VSQTSLFAAGRDGTKLFVRHRAVSDGAASRPKPRAPAEPLAEPLTAVLCDGIACDGFIWKYLWDDLARSVAVAHFHYRGHGRSAEPADPAAIDLGDHAHDLDAVRRAIGDPPVVLFGHSMGCQVALEGYRLRREKVRGMVLICGSPGRITHTFKGTNVLAQWLPDAIQQVDAHPTIARALWSNVPPEMALRVAFFTGEVDTKTVQPEDLLPYMRHMVAIDLPMFLRMLRSAGEHNAADLLPEVDVPVLVIAGDKDSFTPSANAEAMAAALPKGELLMVAGGTHVVPIERRELVADRVATFLRDRLGA
jgi:pimeloyl-ACP methyl ester carboxylesterase